MAEDASRNSPVLPERLIQLVPRFHPDVNGLGDYALCLADALWKSAGVPSDFVVWAHARQNSTLTEERAEDFSHRVFPVAESTPKGLSAALDQIIKQTPKPVVLLHYTSYAFSKEGIPWWLPAVLSRFVEQGGRIVCFFHELYAKGKFPNKTWMTSGLQRHIFQKILALSSAGITSNVEYIEIMRRMNDKNRPLVLAGISSNVGELESPPILKTRSRRMAIFGLYATRKRLYEQHLPLLLRLVEQFGIEEIADLGTVDGSPVILERVRESIGKRFKVYGPLPAQEISRLLADSCIGLVNYNYQLRSKSGIVAAYQSHGVPTVLLTPLGVTQPTELAEDALTAEVVQAANEEQRKILLEQAAAAGFSYYQQHRSYETTLKAILPWLSARSSF